MFKEINWVYYNFDYVVMIRFSDNFDKNDTNWVKLYFENWTDKKFEIPKNQDFGMFRSYLIKND